MPFHVKYSPEQKAVLIRLCTDVGLTVPEAVRTCAAGALGEAPFSINTNTAYGLVSRARRQIEIHEFDRLVQERPYDAMRQLRNETVLMARDWMDEHGGHATAGDMKEILGAVRSLAALTKFLDGPPAPPSAERLARAEGLVDALTERLYATAN
jgi:hypothetical protein